MWVARSVETSGTYGKINTMRMWNRVLLAASITWIFSATLGLLFAVCVSGPPSLVVLRLPSVIPVALIISTVVSVVVTPIAVWSVRTGVRNLLIYAPILWVALATYEFCLVQKTGVYGPYGLVFFAVVGLFILGFIPPIGDVAFTPCGRISSSIPPGEVVLAKGGCLCRKVPQLQLSSPERSATRASAMDRGKLSLKP